MRFAFAGTPPFAATALERLVAAGFEPVLVFTQPDRPAGRGQRLVSSAVKRSALRLAAPLVQPAGLRLDGRHADDARTALERLDAAAPDVLVVAAYGLILPAWMLCAAPLGALNIHASLLPRWRGAAPVQRAIEAGDATTGVSVMQMDEGLDTGAVILARPIPIEPDDTAASLTARLADRGAEAIVEVLHAAARASPRSTSQPMAGVTYAQKIEKREAAIDWRRPAAEIERRVRAFDPFPGAGFECDGEWIKVWRARLGERTAAPAGTVFRGASSSIAVACHDRLLQLVELQRAGGRRQPAEAIATSLPALAGMLAASGA